MSGISREEGSIRSRAAILVAAGFLAGAFTAYYLLWRTHALVAGHPLSLRSPEMLQPSPPPPRTVAAPTPTAATATPTPTPGA